MRKLDFQRENSTCQEKARPAKRKLDLPKVSPGMMTISLEMTGYKVSFGFAPIQPCYFARGPIVSKNR
jgi:hypothetical protein